MLGLFLKHAVAAACGAACCGIVLAATGLLSPAAIVVVAMLAAVACVALVLRASRRLGERQLAKDADDFLDARDTLASAVDFLRTGREDWMCQETIAAAAELSPKVRPLAVYRPALPKGLAILLAVLVALNFAVDTARRKAEIYLAGRAPAEQAAKPAAEPAGRETAAEKVADAEPPQRQEVVRRIEVALPAEEPKAGETAVKETSASESGKTDESSTGDAAMPRGDGRIAQDKFADKVTKINPELAGDMDLKKSAGGKGDEPPALKLDSAQIEEMLKGIKQQKEERKKDEAAAAQVGVGIQAKAPQGSKLSAGSPGGGGGGEEGGGQSGMKTEDTRVQPRRVPVRLVELQIPIEKIQGADAQNPKDEDTSGRVGDAGMLLSRRGAQAEEPFHGGQLCAVARRGSRHGRRRLDSLRHEGLRRTLLQDPRAAGNTQMTGLLCGVWLIAAAYFVYVLRSGYSPLGKTRDFLLLVLRLTVFGLLLSGLCGLTATRSVDEKICNVFLLDVSQNVGPEQQGEQISLPKSILEGLLSRGKDDKAAMLVFGRNTIAAPMHRRHARHFRRRPRRDVHQPGPAGGLRIVPRGIPQSHHAR